ncbi:MAG: leucine-rich repeat domain-containing protein [Mycoplasmoidaceae bacterium]|nr:leucine-rich repeat domain-containing protein [Mycoplasmoidaceae bacterium]
MNRKFFKTFILSPPGIFGCVTACATSSSCSCSSQNSSIPDPRPTKYNPLPYQGTENVFNVDSDGQCLGFIDGFDKDDSKYKNYDTMYIPNTIKSFKNNVFQNMIPSSVKNIIFEDNSEVTKIPDCAFYNTSGIPSLEYVEIPEKVTSVNYYSF